MSDVDAILAANAAYYHAFGHGDFSAMSRIWADDDVSCIHPGWPVLIGRTSILESYSNIFGNPNREWIEHREDTAMIFQNEGRVVCIEIVGTANEAIALAATNWFRRIDGVWRMIHHQASPIAMAGAEATPDQSQRLN